MSHSESLLADFNAEVAATRRIFEALPEDRWTYKPHEKSFDLAGLAGHIAESPAWAASVLEGDFDVTNLGDWKPFQPATKAEVLERFDREVTDFCERFAGLEDGFLEETWTMRAGDQVMMESSRHAAARSFGIHHMIHHRAQLGVYLRMTGTPVPSTYGPTADENPF